MLGKLDGCIESDGTSLGNVDGTALGVLLGIADGWSLGEADGSKLVVGNKDSAKLGEAAIFNCKVSE